MSDVRYYIKYPGGRLRLDAIDDTDAMRKFHNHWTASSTYYCKGCRELVKQESTVLHTMPVKGCK